MLAWPKTPAIQVGSWYEGLMKLLGFNQNGYYMAGHSAIVLVEPKTGQLNYFDFGRYHTPVKHGRIRDNITDPDLKVEIKATFGNKGEIKNLNSILLKLADNKSFHGKGIMYASVNQSIDYKDAYAFAKIMQKRGAIPYGPFEQKGTNCSRFTSSVFRAGNNSLSKKMRLLMPISLTPTPFGNVLVVAEQNNFYQVENLQVTERQLTISRQFKNWIIPSFSIRKKGKSNRNEKLKTSKSLIALSN